MTKFYMNHDGQPASVAPLSPPLDDRDARLGNLKKSLQTACLRLAEADSFFSMAEFEHLLDHIRALEDAVALKLDAEPACNRTTSD